MKLLNKPIEFYGTASIASNENMHDLVSIGYSTLVAHPVDMIVFDIKDDKTIVRSAGYDLETQTKLDEKTILRDDLNKNTITEKIWLKVDNYGEKFIATFLYPSEY